jgi:hypothetical protein
MPMRPGLLVVPLIAAFVCLPANADPPGSSCPDYTPANPWHEPVAYSAHSPRGPWLMSHKTRELLSLRKEALAEQQADGGTLSADHKAALQARLDAINHGDF